MFLHNCPTGINKDYYYYIIIIIIILLQVGDRVLTVRTLTGSYAEYTKADVMYVSHLHKKLSFQEGTCIGIPYYTAYKSLLIRFVIFSSFNHNLD